MKSVNRHEVYGRIDEGYTDGEIAQEFGITRRRALNLRRGYMKLMNIRRKKPPFRPSADDLIIIIQLYADGMEVAEIGDKFECDGRAIQDWLNKVGLGSRRISDKMGSLAMPITAITTGFLKTNDEEEIIVELHQHPRYVLYPITKHPKYQKLIKEAFERVEN
jgi:hypothetical protein